MRIRATRLMAILLGLSMLLTAVPGARAAATAPPPPAGSDNADSIGVTIGNSRQRKPFPSGASHGDRHTGRHRCPD